MSKETQETIYGLLCFIGFCVALYFLQGRR